MAIKKFSEKEIRLRRKFIKEAINLRGYVFYYYSLDIDKTKNTSEYSSLYNESPQEYHFYNRFEIKGTIQTGNAELKNKKWGIETVQKETSDLITAEIYYLTPQDKWADDFGENTILPNEFEESDLFLKVIPKVGDYLRYPKSGNQFFEITSVYNSGWDFFETYMLTLMQRPYIVSEETLSSSIEKTVTKNINQRDSESSFG